MNSKKGLYVHIPFCISKCSYCDFYSKVNIEKIDTYLKALVKEQIRYKNSKIDSIFIGGGSPSLLDERQIDYLFSNLAKNFDLESTLESTIECNPSDITKEKLKAYKNNKINRISIGVQTLNDNTLKYIERRHDRKTAIEKLALANEYFKNISVDLIIGLPKNENQIIKDIEVLQRFVKHISIYSLIIEEKTKIHKQLEKGEFSYDEDSQVFEYEEIKRKLEQNSFNRYEVSNFCKKGYECIHNIKYWRSNPYIALGCSASGYLDNYRYKNISNIDKYINYINSNKDICVEREYIDIEERLYEEVIFSLRMDCGVNIKNLNEKYKTLTDKYLDVFKKNNQYFNEIHDNISIKQEYTNCMNQILSLF